MYIYIYIYTCVFLMGIRGNASCLQQFLMSSVSAGPGSVTNKVTMIVMIAIIVIVIVLKSVLNGGRRSAIFVDPQ